MLQLLTLTTQKPPAPLTRVQIVTPIKTLIKQQKTLPAPIKTHPMRRLTVPPSLKTLSRKQLLNKTKRTLSITLPMALRMKPELTQTTSKTTLLFRKRPPTQAAIWLPFIKQKKNGQRLSRPQRQKPIRRQRRLLLQSLRQRLSSEQPIL